MTNPLTPEVESDGPRPTGRSLVPFVTRPQADGGFGYSRPSAPFLAQLIGVAQGVPQARLRRRLGPADASAIYEAVGQRTAPTSRLRASL